MKNVIYSINGPVVQVEHTSDFSMMELVYVGNKRLTGEVISISDEFTTIQVYEVTTGLRVGEPVVPSGMMISVTLGPGIISNIFDGIQRPLIDVEKFSKSEYILEGANVASLDEEKKWCVTPEVYVGQKIKAGQIYASCPETKVIKHRLMVPYAMDGTVIDVAEKGEYTINDTIVQIQKDDGTIVSLTLAQKWPIRLPRPVASRILSKKPLITGQRVIDTMFPIAKGGTAAIPGGFGTGKTMTQHQVAKWCDADIIVYIGCGERGNEMTQVLSEFSELIDPKSGYPLTERTVLIANTSNMPVSAREASIYTGITMAEYYRDMGYHVAIMADSTSRWAEALREISGRLEEMPAEEGFPAYLPSRIAQFYERAGYMETLGGDEGSVTIIGAVSPQGSDFSEPVTQNTKRFVRCFWALEKSLAYSRHYPAINWNTSYSEYLDDLNAWYEENVDDNFPNTRSEISLILKEENRLMEIVKLIGADVLPDDQKLIIEIAKLIRVGFLQQNAFHKIDTFVPIKKQMKMMEVILFVYERSKNLTSQGIPLKTVMENSMYDSIIKMKYNINNDDLQKFDTLKNEIDENFRKLRLA